MTDDAKILANRILIVDDITDNIDIIRKFLEPEHYHIFVATSGEKALKIASAVLPDLILLDVMMPGIDGFETCCCLKKDKRMAQIPVIFVTAKKDAISMGFKSGGVDFIGKPIQREELVARVKLHLKMQDLQRQQRDQLLKAEKMAALGELVAGFTHEINTPIGLGITAVTHLRDETRIIQSNYNDKKMTKQHFEDYLQECGEVSNIVWENLQRTVQLISGFKQISIDQSSEVRRHFDIKQYLSQILLSLHPKLKHTQHKVVLEGEEGIELDSYPGYIAQIITNLVMNSLIHAFDKGSQGCIKLQVKQREEQLWIGYQDNGRGIPSGDIDRVFEKYFTTKMDQGGSGLGLHIVHQLVTEKLKGTISCESDGDGVQFQISLPVVAD